MPFRSKDHGDTQDRVARNVVDVALSNITDSIIDTHSAVKVLAITVTAEIGLLAMLYVSKDKAADFLAENEPDILSYGAIAVFMIGFLTAFALYRMISNRWHHRNSGIYIWLASIAAGTANVLLFFGILTLEIR